MSFSLTEARQKADEARKQIEAAQEVLSQSVKTAIEEGFTPLFEEYPFLGSIVWTQYTPYFNDGDTCVFSSSFTYPSVNSVTDVEQGTESYHGEEPGEDFGKLSDEETYLGYDRETRTTRYEPNSDYNPRYGECYKAVKDLAEAIAGDEKRIDWDTPTSFNQALHRIFGDHALVRITRDGVVVDLYEHD